MKAPDSCVLPMPGLEADNLLAFLALLGLLRSLESAQSQWIPRASWRGPPWRAHLHLAEPAGEGEVSAAAADGVLRIAEQFDDDGRNDVKFERAEFRRFAARVTAQPVASALAAAMTAEFPTKEGATYASPYVMISGQGHQHFVQRLVAVARSEHEALRSSAKIAEALFKPWRRTDKTDAFRWDPEEAQRYALRFDDPSGEGAAPTVHGANRLAAIGFLSFPCVPSSTRLQAVGSNQTDDGVGFTWPIWGSALTVRAIEDLLVHPALFCGDVAALAPLGIAEIIRARRVSIGKYRNVTRAVPVTPSAGFVGSGGRRSAAQRNRN